MNARVVVDPITRIEGHLRIEAQMEGDQIAQAYSSGTMVRGIEIILRDRDPRDAWAFAQRICGVCTLVHGIASVRSVENAIGAKVPPNAELIRNLMIGAQYIHDHVMHFYHLHALDWVDVVSALSADPVKTAELAQSLTIRARLPATSVTCRKKSRILSKPDNSVFLPKATGDIRNTGCRPKPISWPWLTTWTHWSGSATSRDCTRFSAARTRTRTSWWAACPARST
jgi:Ni,Fe-hydrogenase I large subunit